MPPNQPHNIPAYNNNVYQYSSLCGGNAWCTYEAVDDISIIIQYLMLAVLGVGLVIVGRYYYKLIKLRQIKQYALLFQSLFVRVYAIVFIWLLCSIIKICINIFAYHQYIGTDFMTFPQPTQQAPIVILSALFLAFDMSATFFVIGLIILIPYQWFKFLLNHLNRDPQQIPLESRKLYSKSFTLLKIIRIYMLARSILLLFFFIQAGLLIHTDFGCKLPSFEIRIIFIVVECIIILILYLFVLYVAEHTKKIKLVRMDVKDYKRLRCQYCLLMLALIARVFLNSFFNGLADHIMSYKPQKNCFDSDQSNNIKRALFLILGYGIMHFLPIGLIVYIYRPNIQTRQRDEHILDYSQNIITDQSVRSDQHNNEIDASNNVNVTEVQNKYHKLG